MKGDTAQLAPKVVVIMGNGFDLDMNLKTRYIDFVNSNYFKPLIDGDLSIVRELSDFDVYKDDMIVNPNGLAKFVKKNEEERKWVDLEIDIRDYCINDESLKNYKKVSKELFAIRYFLSKYIERFGVLKLNSVEMKEHAGYRVMEKLVELNADYQIWDFNYTYTCPYILSTLNIAEETLHDRLHFIHGSLEQGRLNHEISIVLGTRYDPKVLSVCPAAIKANSAKDYNAMMQLFQDQLMEAESMLVLGHSMGETDAQYFEDVFRSSNNLKKVVVINKTDASCEEVQTNIDKISDDSFMRKVEKAQIEYLSFSTEGYFDPLLLADQGRREQLDSILDRCLTYNTSFQLDL